MSDDECTNEVAKVLMLRLNGELSLRVRAPRTGVDEDEGSLHVLTAAGGVLECAAYAECERTRFTQSGWLDSFEHRHGSLSQEDRARMREANKAAHLPPQTLRARHLSRAALMRIVDGATKLEVLRFECDTTLELRYVERLVDRIHYVTARLHLLPLC